MTSSTLSVAAPPPDMKRAKFLSRQYFDQRETYESNKTTDQAKAREAQ
jgi:hypothetical protein